MSRKIDGRFQVTERTFVQHTRKGIQTWPASTDPLARATKRYTGVFDLRDTHKDKAIVCSDTNLKALRRIQARLNTSHYLDVGVMHR